MSLAKELESRRKKNGVPAWAMAAGIALLFLGLAGFAKATGHWNSHIPAAVYLQIVPHANLATHPMPWISSGLISQPSVLEPV